MKEINLREMRENKQSIALLYQATGMGKTVTAVLDAKSVGGITLFVARAMDLVLHIYQTFQLLWKVARVGQFADSVKEWDAAILNASHECGLILTSKE